MDFLINIFSTPTPPSLMDNIIRITKELEQFFLLFGNRVVISTQQYDYQPTTDEHKQHYYVTVLSFIVGPKYSWREYIDISLLVRIDGLYRSETSALKHTLGEFTIATVLVPPDFEVTERSMMERMDQTTTSPDWLSHLSQSFAIDVTTICIRSEKSYLSVICKDIQNMLKEYVMGHRLQMDIRLEPEKLKPEN